jgi:putative tricarboxylic transport membrane protein
VAPERVDGIDIPTAAEQGYDISLTNWRSLSAPAGLSGEDREALVELVLETLDTPEWADAMTRYHWTEKVLTGDELDAFLVEEHERIAQLYEEMGQ